MTNTTRSIAILVLSVLCSFGIGAEVGIHVAPKPDVTIMQCSQESHPIANTVPGVCVNSHRQIVATNH